MAKATQALRTGFKASFGWFAAAVSSKRALLINATELGPRAPLSPSIDDVVRARRRIWTADRSDQLLRRRRV
jgi:hypothetical protein